MSYNIIKQKIISHIATTVPQPYLWKLSGTNLLLPYYHMVSDDEIIHIKHFYPHKTQHQFNEDIEFILKHFTPIDLSDLMAAARREKKLPQRAVHMTFDDGFREMHDIVSPFLLRKGVPATFFINSDFTDNRNMYFQHKSSLIIDHLLGQRIPKSLLSTVEKILPQENKQNTSLTSRMKSIKYLHRNVVDIIAANLNVDINGYLKKHQPYLTTEQIHSMIKRGFTFGAHSIDHPLYVELDLNEQLRQTITSIDFVKKNFHLNYRAFAFPHTDYGVSKEYFNSIKKSGLVDISFGTVGFIADCQAFHFQRFSLEKPMIAAEQNLAYHLSRRIWRIINRKNTIVRN